MIASTQFQTCFNHKEGVTFVMTQILDPVPDDHLGRILCCYINATSQIQVARITNIQNWYFERVVFPGQRLLFEATSDAHLEIHSGMMASAILSDTIPCTKLCIAIEPTAQVVSSTGSVTAASTVLTIAE